MVRVKARETGTPSEQTVMSIMAMLRMGSAIERIDLNAKTRSRNDTGQRSGRIRNLRNPKIGISSRIGIRTGLNEKKANGTGMNREHPCPILRQGWRGSSPYRRGFPIEVGMYLTLMGTVKAKVLVMAMVKVTITVMAIDGYHLRLIEEIDKDAITSPDRECFT